MNTVSVKRDLLESFKEREYRQAFNLENVYTSICFQLRALREQRELSQSGLGRLVHMAQERISILEDPNAETKPTLHTLLRLADGFDVGLEVRFVPFSTVLDRSVDTNMKGLEVASFSDELPIMESRLYFSSIPVIGLISTGGGMTTFVHHPHVTGIGTSGATTISVTTTAYPHLDSRLGTMGTSTYEPLIAQRSTGPRSSLFLSSHAYAA